MKVGARIISIKNAYASNTLHAHDHAHLEAARARFKDLLERVDVSRGTLASRIKEAEGIGLIEKGIRKSNGSPAYTLTEEGEKTKEQGDKKAK